MVVDRKNHTVEHGYFYQLGNYLRPDDILIVNETKVIPARIYGRKAGSGGRVEVLLLRKVDQTCWETLVGGRGLGVGRRIVFDEGLEGEVIEVQDGPRRIVRFNQPIEEKVKRLGEAPLPPYIQTRLDNPDRYQTIYAKWEGSVAAPTAGMHFTQRLIGELTDKGIQFGKLTLHIGLDTFAPVKEDDPQQHMIHTEWCEVPQETVEIIHRAKERGGRVIAVGTTSVRALETAVHRSTNGHLAAYQGATDLYILPGFQFKVVEGMITNFHLPRSTLLMLVSAFVGREWLLSLYQEAIARRYRFYSFGDAMLIL